MKKEQAQVKLPIYLDYQASTPIEGVVMDAMLPYFLQKFGNPHSHICKFGEDAALGVERARAEVAALIGANSEEIIFTSGATESNNLALKGVARFYKREYGKNHIVSVVTEHKSVLGVCEALKREGFAITLLSVNSDGLINLEDLRASLCDKTIIVSVMAVNNEIGVIQPVEQIGQLCKERGVLFHSDIAQACGKISLDISKIYVNMLSVSGHKMYGPKGVGALYIRKKPRIRLDPIFSGGEQERGIRSGTVPVPLVVGLGAASVLAKHKMQDDFKHIKMLSNLVLKRLEDIPMAYVNGSKESGLPGCINLSFAGVEGEALLAYIANDVCASSGSACTASDLSTSHVIRALGMPAHLQNSSIRIGIGRYTTRSEIIYAMDVIQEAVETLRSMSPVWDVLQRGGDPDVHLK
jgi:cysteine desulfurase